MKRLIALFLIVLTLFTVAGCGAPTKAMTPEASVNGFFQAMQEGDLDKAEEYLDGSTITETIEEQSNLPEAETILSAVCGKIAFEILSTQSQDDGSVKVTISLTTVEMLPLLKDYAADVLHYTVDYAFDEEKPSEKEVLKQLGVMFRECASDPDLKTYTVELNVIVSKTEDGGWKIEADNEFVNAVLGGLVEAWRTASQVLDLINSAQSNEK